MEEYRATSTYWLCLLAAFVVTGAWSSAAGGVTQALLIFVLLLPVYQLAASLIAGVIALIIAGPAALTRIWRITCRGFLGAVIGLGIMLIPLFTLKESWGAMLLAVLVLLATLSFMYSLRRRSQRA